MGRKLLKLVPQRFCLPPLISHGPKGRDSFPFYGIAATGSYDLLDSLRDAPPQGKPLFPFID